MIKHRHTFAIVLDKVSLFFFLIKTSSFFPTFSHNHLNLLLNNDYLRHKILTTK